jgi:class 3 adenylate cyclase/predicted ATPase
MDIGEWLRQLGLEEYAPAFRENGIDGRVLPDLTAEDLKDLGVTMVGHRRQLLKAIGALRPGASPAVEWTGVSPPAVVREAERRHLSVMFCDLVDSTPLSVRLDPEDLGDVLREYQARVQDTIAHFGGFIALYVGDGVLIYFGWPEAHEGDAERAVRAALAVVAAVGCRPVRGEKLEVRIGIATGLVVVGEAIGAAGARQNAVVGETPNRAARLQGLAGPNGIAIDAVTRQEIGGLFEYHDLGLVALKGLPESVRAWLVQGESGAVSRFEALRAGRLTPLIGRREELDLLRRCWRQAARGEGNLALVCGEPGIGKSRLLTALEERLRDELRARRRQLHARVAEALEELSPKTAGTEPEVIAQHYTAAGLAETAISWWRRAADGAAQRSAHAEAVTHLRRALELLPASTRSARRTVLELDLQLALGVAWISAKSYATPEAGEAYARARELCQQVGDSAHLFPALRGLWAFYRHRAEYQAARGVAEQFLNLAEKLQNSAPLLEAHRVMGLTLFDVGELCTGLDHLERAIALYDPQRHGAHAVSYGQDPGVASLCQAGLLLWMLGYPDRASKQMHRGVALAERLEHPFSLSGALFCSTQLSQLRRELAQAQVQAERAIEISVKHGFSYFESQCVILRGWARAMRGEHEDGIADIRRGLAAYEALGAKGLWPAYAVLMAEALAKAGEVGEGLDVLGQAKRTQELRWEPELERVEGELMLSQGAAEMDVEALFRHAFNVAKRQCAKSFELRTAVSWTGLLWRQGRLDEARDLLSSTYGWFSEGLDTEDLARARRLLCELGAGGIPQ